MTQPIREPHRFDVFAKQEKGGWRFDGIVEALNQESAKQLAMNNAGTDNPARICVYPSR